MSIVDSRGASHTLLPLPGSGGEDRHAAVSCPTAECTLKGSSGASRLAIMEPKELGPLSLCALILVAWGSWFFVAGLLASAIVLALSLPRGPAAPRPADPAAAAKSGKRGSARSDREDRQKRR